MLLGMDASLARLQARHDVLLVGLIDDHRTVESATLVVVSGIPIRGLKLPLTSSCLYKKQIPAITPTLSSKASSWSVVSCLQLTNHLIEPTRFTPFVLVFTFLLLIFLIVEYSCHQRKLLGFKNCPTKFEVSALEQLCVPTCNYTNTDMLLIIKNRNINKGQS